MFTATSTTRSSNNWLKIIYIAQTFSDGRFLAKYGIQHFRCALVYFIPESPPGIHPAMIYFGNYLSNISKLRNPMLIYYRAVE